ncbi:MAG: hypothetical protein MMC33_005022 [Icmadophila ericetorum]|nr:hypothetical protein [Icmadophila ericetorum]
MSTPTVIQFLSELGQILINKDGEKLDKYLVFEPPFPPIYNQVINELRQSYPEGLEDTLKVACKQILPEDQDGGSGGYWTAFLTFLVQYFVFVRDVNKDQLLETHDMLRDLLNHGTLALSDNSMGFVVVPTIISVSRTLARLSIGLDKRPDLVAQLRRRESIIDDGEGTGKVTLVESSANAIREALKKCLAEKSGNAEGVDSNGKPIGRRTGIYILANLCLKLFYHCHRLRNSEQVFSNIYQQSPKLSYFPASQRVTYLYYLGRYHFVNCHYYRAQSALQAAYDQCHRHALKQRRRILLFLVASNIILGRFPTYQLLQRPEAQDFGAVFLPIIQAIKKGDLATSRKILGKGHDISKWLLKRRLLLQIRSRCEVLIWRTLARRLFLLTGFKGDKSNKAPSLGLENLRTVLVYLEKRALGLVHDRVCEGTQHTRRPHTNSIFILNQASENPTNGASIGPLAYVHPDLEGEVDPGPEEYYTMMEVETGVASLIQQDLMHGYISHKYARFIITGAKGKSVVDIGFPNVWQTIEGQADKKVPGWVRVGDEGELEDGRSGLPKGGMGGTVINLANARPAGAGPG